MSEVSKPSWSTQRQDLAGQRFGKLVAIDYFRVRLKSGTSVIKWRCRCDCGKETAASSSNLKSGNTASCGCLGVGNRLKGAAASVTHGKTRTPEFRAWQRMLTRCNNPNATQYPNYGRRGIRVCEEWSESFEAFLSHVGNQPTPKHSIDRIDVNGNYEPGNVRWATQVEQQNNRRSNRIVEAFGKSQTVAEWAKSIGMSSNTLFSRLNRGWSPEKALAVPPDARHRRKHQPSSKA